MPASKVRPEATRKNEHRALRPGLNCTCLGRLRAFWTLPARLRARWPGRTARHSPVGDKIEQKVGVGQRYASPRVNTMIASVSSPLPAWPRSLSKQIACRFASALMSTTLPSAARRNSTLLPGTISRRSRTGLGMVICLLRLRLPLRHRAKALPERYHLWARDSSVQPPPDARTGDNMLHDSAC
jgi:hypothetical protein